MSRTSTAVAPHPLFDSLKFVAGDYLDCVDIGSVKDKEKEIKHISLCFQQYIDLLRRWCESDYSHPSVCAAI
jgi:hypothetical protein